MIGNVGKQAQCSLPELSLLGLAIPEDLCQRHPTIGHPAHHSRVFVEYKSMLKIWSWFLRKKTVSHLFFPLCLHRVLCFTFPFAILSLQMWKPRLSWCQCPKVIKKYNPFTNTMVVPVSRGLLQCSSHTS